MEYYKAFLRIFCLLLLLSPFKGEADGSSALNIKALSFSQSQDTADKFQEIVSSNSKRLSIKQEQVVKIAMVTPSNDVSDFWTRSYIALTRRLSELEIEFSIKMFPSKQIEHSLQTHYTDEILQNREAFDFIVFGPSELEIQSNNIQRLSAVSEFDTFIWAFHTPDESWKYQPKAWFDFSSATGAQKICHFLVEKLGNDIKVVLNRGIPGITDNQRSGDFKSCVQQKGNWQVLYEHFGQYQEYGGKDGADFAAKYFPEAEVLHSANTAMAVGAVKGLKENGILNKVIATGWGGTDTELQLIRRKELNATPMRMSDDVGVATAEAIKLTLERKDSEIPYIYLGRITVANDDMTDQELTELSKEAFRYSKDGKLNQNNN